MTESINNNEGDSTLGDQNPVSEELLKAFSGNETEEGEIGNDETPEASDEGTSYSEQNPTGLAFPHLKEMESETEDIPSSELLPDVVFTEQKGNFVSSAPGRKRIVLFSGSERPIPGRRYEVRILEDTEPNDPNKGKYVVRVIKSGEEISDEEWQTNDKDLDDLELAQRQGHIAGRTLYQETGIPAEQRHQMQPEEIINRAPLKSLAEKSVEMENVNLAVTELLLQDKSSPASRLLELKRENLTSALRQEDKFDKGIEELLAEEVAILGRSDEAPTGPQLKALQEVRTTIAAVQDEKHKLLLSSPEAYYGLHLKELKSFQQSERIIETGYVREKAKDALVHLQANKPVLIYGHYGSGKTELAMHIARKYMDKDALVISGAKNMSTAELYGHQVLSLDQIDRTELDTFTKEVEGKFNAWTEENRDKLKDLDVEEREAEKNRAHDRYLQTFLSQFRSGTISEFFMGPIYQAMEQGRPIIIDEVNAIPHEVLISLNHILTRKVGDKVAVQQDSGREVEIQPGYGVMMTGNLNQGDTRYIDRQDMDPAFLSRLYKIDYDYLPQSTEGSLKGEWGRHNELFQLIIAKSIDRNGNLEVPEGSVEKLWELAKAARVIQNVFSGKEINSAFYFQEGGARSMRYILKEAVLSNRAITNILGQWQKEGYRNELDYYLWNEFVSQATEPSDRAYLYQILKDRFNFFQDEGWEQRPNYGSGGRVATFDIKAPTNAAKETTFYGPRQVVDFTFGPGPKRFNWPTDEKAE